MPIYVYECPHCGKQEEYHLPITEDTIIFCDEKKCKRKYARMNKIIAPTSFILKGPGWAKDGYSK